MNSSQVFGFSRRLYATAVVLGAPLLRLHQRSRARRGKEDVDRREEREGLPSVVRPVGKVVWFHCASVGESVAALPVIEKLLRDHVDLSVLMTTGTVTSARLMADRLPDRAIHQYAPLDHSGWVGRFLDHWKPDAAVWVESEFWPNTLWALKQRSIPVMLVNGRISQDSYTRWKRVSPIIRGILGCFDVCLAQTEQDARHLVDLGAREVALHGNLKLGAEALPVEQEALTTLRDALHDRPRWLVSSSHEGEEEIAARVHTTLADRFPSLLTIIVPRHPARGTDIASQLRDMGLTVSVRSEGETLSQETSVYIADTMGELGLFYRVCKIVFMGKSLIQPGGGQNPFEPMKLGCATIFGPNMGNFEELSEAMVSAKAAIGVLDINALEVAVAELLENPDSLAGKQRMASEFCAQCDSIIDDTVLKIEHLMQMGLHAER